MQTAIPPLTGTEQEQAMIDDLVDNFDVRAQQMDELKRFGRTSHSSVCKNGYRQDLLKSLMMGDLKTRHAAMLRRKA
jgi:hypothetical protein